MKKNAYTAPTTAITLIATEQLLNTISNPTDTNVDGLDVSNVEYEGDGRSRSHSLWDDED